MKYHVTLYTPTPDHGDRFQRMWADFHSEARHTFLQRAIVSAQIAIGAVFGIVIAWVL